MAQHRAFRPIGRDCRGISAQGLPGVRRGEATHPKVAGQDRKTTVLPPRSLPTICRCWAGARAEAGRAAGRIGQAPARPPRDDYDQTSVPRSGGRQGRLRRRYSRSSRRPWAAPARRAAGGFDCRSQRRWHSRPRGPRVPRRLSHPGGGFGRRHYVHFDLGHFIHAQHAVIVEVTLFDLALLEGDLAVHDGPEAEADTALHLGGDDVGIDGRAAVHRAHHSIDLDLAVGVDADLRDLRHISVERLGDRDPAAPCPLGSGPLFQPAFSAASSSTVFKRG